MAVADHLNGALRRVPTWMLYAIAVVPPVYMFIAALNGNLGVDPVKSLEHEMGELGLKVLIATLVVTPLRQFNGLNLIRFRRALGVIGFFYIFLHLLVWLVLDVQIMSQIISDIAKRPYITIGMAAFILIAPLAVTSNNWSVRKLGPKWRKLHKLFYPAIVLGGVHYVMVVKGWQAEPLVYLGVIALLLATRFIPKTTKRRTTSRESTRS